MEIIMQEKNPIQVAGRIFLVLETLAAFGPLGLSDLSRELSLNKTTVHRILNSLIFMGYVKQDSATARYRLSFKIWDIANQLLSKMDILQEARPYLRELSAAAGETVHLVQREGIHAVYIDKVESENSIRLVSKVGKRIPLYCSGVGKALLADLPDDVIQTIWEQSPHDAVTPHTVTDFSKFMKMIEETRINGFASDDEENELGVRCIAVSLPLREEAAHYAFSVSGPIHRMDAEHMEKAARYALELKKRWLKSAPL